MMKPQIMHDFNSNYLDLPLFFKGSIIRSYLQDKPIAFSFEVADRCPVNCNCYWRAQERVKELSDEEVITFFKQKRKEGYLQANLVGGSLMLDLSF